MMSSGKRQQQHASSASAPEETSDYAAKFLKRREKKADTTFDFEVRGKMSDGSHTQWHTKFDKTLEYLMYPSLNMLPDDPVFADKQESNSKPGSRQQGGGGRGGDGPGSPSRGGRMNRSNTMTTVSTGGGLGSAGGGSKANMRARSPNRKGGRSPSRNSIRDNDGRSRSPSPFNMGKRTGNIINELLSDDEDNFEMEEEEDETMEYARPNVLWQVEVTAVDKLPETQAQKDRRAFLNSLNEVGEKHLRDDLRGGYEAERKRKLKLLAEQTREDKFRSLAGSSQKHKKDQTELNKAIEDAPHIDRANTRRGQVGAAFGAGTAAGGRRESTKLSGTNMMEVMNRPEYIYTSLRNAATKKKVLMDFDMKTDNESDEHIYNKQRSEIEKILKGSERGDVETAFEMEGLLYYRFHYDAEHEEKLRKNREDEDARVHTKLSRSGTMKYSSQKGAGSLTATGNEGTVEEEMEHKSEYEKLMVKTYKGTRKAPVSAKLQSDLNTVNLGRLRRAINMRLSSFDHDYLLDQREVRALQASIEENEHEDDGAENSENNNNKSKGVDKAGGLYTPIKADKNKRGNKKYPPVDAAPSGSPAGSPGGKGLRSRPRSPNNTSSPGSPGSSKNPMGIRRSNIGKKYRKSRNTPMSHLSPLRPESEIGDDSPLHEIRDRALNQYIKDMGLERYKGAASEAFGLGTNSATADSVDGETAGSNLVTGLGEKTMTVAKGGSPSPTKSVLGAGDEIGTSMSGGMTNQDILVKTIGANKHVAVSGGTRMAQDSLLMRQLRAGVVPEEFIRRSNTLEHIDIDIRNYGIGDEQGACLGGAIRGLDTLRALVLEDNRLTSKSISIIVKNIAPKSLTLLDLSCNNAHNAGSSAVAAYVKGANALTTLSMNKCDLKDDDMPLICMSMRNNKNMHIIDLQLNNNRIGPDGALTLAKVLQTSGCTIQSLDLAWNYMGTEGAVPMAKALEECSSIENVDFSACSIDDTGGQALAIMLKRNTSLKVVALAQNNIAAGSCFVFSKTCATHPNLVKLDLSSNPVGEAGARSVYRQIMRGLRCFVVMRSCSYFYDDKVFNYTTPSLDSPYQLDMTKPYDSAVMAELLYMAAEHPTTCRFGSVKYTQTSGGTTDEFYLEERNGEVLNRRKKFNVPETGLMNVEFYSSVNMPSMKNQISNKSLHVVKLIIKGAREQDRIDYLRLITADLHMTCAQAQDLIQFFMENQIIGSGGLRKMDILACTWMHLIDTKNMYDFMVNNIPKAERRALINEVSIDEYKFNWTNPTGHWRLNLEQRTQLFVMMKLIAINKVESDFSRDFKQSGRGDTSQEGNWFNFRNAKMVTSKGSKNIVISQEFVDHLPRTGIIDFDYVSTTRPGAPHMMEQEFIPRLADGIHGRLLAKEESHRIDDITGMSDPNNIPDPHAHGKQGKKKPGVLDKYEVISDYEFYSFLEKLGLSSRNRITVANSLFPLIELQLAVTKHWFTVKHAMMVMDCFQNDNHTQANVTCCMFSRLKDLGNMDVLLRSCQKQAQRMILKRLGCLNVLNPLKLALDYKISLMHIDERILLTCLLEISPHEGTDQIREDNKTDVSVLTFYGALHRIVAMERQETLIFTYLETGIASNVVAWSLRRDSMKRFLVGTNPLDRALFRVVGMYREMEKAQTLSRGPIELQYMTHLKIMKKNNRIKDAEKKGKHTVDKMRSDTDQHAKEMIKQQQQQVGGGGGGKKIAAGGGAAAAAAITAAAAADAAASQSTSSPNGDRLATDAAAAEVPVPTTGDVVVAAGTLAATAAAATAAHDSDDDDHEHVGDHHAAALDDHDDEALFGNEEEEDKEEDETLHEGDEDGAESEG